MEPWAKTPKRQKALIAIKIILFNKISKKFSYARAAMAVPKVMGSLSSKISK
jgi:hypothetical protein